MTSSHSEQGGSDSPDKAQWNAQAAVVVVNVLRCRRNGEAFLRESTVVPRITDSQEWIFDVMGWSGRAQTSWLRQLVR